MSNFFIGLFVGLFVCWIMPIILNWMLCMIMIWCFKKKPMYVYNIHELADKIYDAYLVPILSWVGYVFSIITFFIILGEKICNSAFGRFLSKTWNILWTIPISWLVKKFKKIRIK